ncbi:helix-turn-helix transcriptional regulator [Streptomyces sp. NPDC053367]|uniref:helix-turn-helix transcriptional regulator n=1 Tax=Streptomyces sp. NPDC053367 TaxID=3365700 RepID=UPI0037D50077
MTAYDGARARTLRRAAGLGIESLAVVAGVSPSTIRTSESGHHQPRARVADAIARALGVTRADLLQPCPARTLREIRTLLGRTQTEIAALVGVVRQRVSQVERGVVISVRAPERWAAAYGLTPAQWACALQASQNQARKSITAQVPRRRRTRPRGDT